MKFNKIRNQKGFTFIELMITVAVAGIAIVAILGSNVIIRQGAESAYQRTTAIQDANQVVEQMRNAAESAAVSFQTTVLNAGTTAAGVVGSLPNGTNEVITVTNNGNITDDPLDVTVTVSWNERGVRPVTTSLRTLITRRITS